VERIMQGLELTIFLSGTMEDLREERTALREQGNLLPLYRVVAAEDWGARCHPPRDLCIRAARESDVYLGLYAGRYGHVPDGEEISVTEWEFDTAREAGKPILIYIRRGRKGHRQRAFLERVSDFDVGYNRRPEFEGCDQLVAWVREDLTTLLEDLLEEPDGGVLATRDPLIYVKCRLNLALQAKESGQWEQAVRHCQWVLNQGVRDLAHDFALGELQSLYKTRGWWDDAIEVARARVELVGVLASEQRVPSGHIVTYEMDGFQRARSLDLASLYVEWARVDAGGGRWQEAVDHLEEALEIYGELSESSGEKGIQGILAETYETWAKSCEGMPRRAERMEAIRAYKNAIKIYESLRDHDKLAALWHRLAQIRLQDGKKLDALQYLKRSLGHQFENDTPRAAVDEIVANLQSLSEIRRQLGYWRPAVETLLRQVEVLLWAGRQPQAIRVAERALELCLDIDKPRLLLDSQEALGRAYEAAGTLEGLENALAAYQQVLDLAEELRARSKIGALRESIDRVSERIAGFEEREKANLGGKDAPTS
jgi:tetratricopeptide (TPR) repeat protein